MMPPTPLTKPPDRSAQKGIPKFCARIGCRGCVDQNCGGCEVHGQTVPGTPETQASQSGDSTFEVFREEESQIQTFREASQAAGVLPAIL